MRVRHQPLALPTIAASKLVIHDVKRIPETFSKNQPVVIEIGCGKGLFIQSMAAEYPDYNFIGIEQQASVLYHAIKDLEVKDNLRFIHTEIDEPLVNGLPKVEKFYLLFSDPWPKARHEKRRLTNRKRLEQYALYSNQLHFRTDNQSFYEYSIEEIKESPYKLDAHGILVATSSLIQTEFELKYRIQGKPIYYIEASK